MNRTQAVEYARILKRLIELAEVSIILSNFIRAFVEDTVQKADGCWYLFGNFNIGGTKSGRLSSSDINLQNLPSTGSKYAKDVKLCFAAPPGWSMAGADFNSLEDMISALTTKDPNKLKVYTEGYDGHSLRAYSYFGTQMPDIVNTVESINSIQKLYKPLRQRSKGPTFALTYQGTWYTLVNSQGFTEEEAREIERNYHILYEVSDAWVQDKIQKASVDGYTTVAFGLRLRTPILHQTVLGTRSTPYEAVAEGRTMGNAHGQSYGMLNNRAAIEFQKRLLASPHRFDILPISHIHDATYYIFKLKLDVVKWLNDNLIECMQWQELPEIEHPTVKLGGELSVFYPNWAVETVIPNGATETEIDALF